MNEFENTQKAKGGIDRLIGAARISLQGLGAAYREKAFRMEAVLACVLVPLSFYVGQSWLEVMVLNILVFMVLIAEVINSAIEAVVDRIGPERHPLSGAAKDMGSAAVFLALLLCGFGWMSALWKVF